MNQIERGRRFQQLHSSNATFLMPNAWDEGSAVMLASAGFPAIATTSAGICFSLGLPDRESEVSKDDMLSRVGKIAGVVDLPVSADLHSGYGSNPEEVSETIKHAIQAGLVGANLEDYSENPSQPLFDIKHATARIQAARHAADESGIPFVITARTDTFLTGADNAFAETIERCSAYREAGADCLFVPGASDPETIEALVRELNGPLTVVMGLQGSTLNVKQLESLGVRRITIGGSLARASFGLIRKAAAEMFDSGSFSFADDQIPQAELSQFFTDQREK